MSYLFDGSNDRITGSFTSTYGDPLTIAAFIKVANHPAVNDQIVMLGNISNSIDNSYGLRTGTVDNQWQATSLSNESPSRAGSASVTFNADGSASPQVGAWTPIVGKFNGDASRNIYVNTIATTSANTNNRPVSDVIQYISLGENLAQGSDFVGRIAEVAVWNSALSDADITRYMSGEAASEIAAANLIGYWPLSASNVTQSNIGVDAGGDLTVSGATFSSEHPSISAGVPAWTAAPTMTSQTSTAYTVGFTPDSSCTIYGVAVISGSTAPTAQQIIAGLNGSGSAAKANNSKAVTGVDTLVLTPSDSPAFPIYDLYFVLGSSSSPIEASTIEDLLVEPLDAPAGFQFVTIAGLPWGATEDSILDGASPALVDGDIIRCSSTTTPGGSPQVGYALEMDPDGVASFNAGEDTERQTFTAHVYDVSVGAYSDVAPITFYVNNSYPEFTGDSDTLLFRRNVAIESIVLSSLWADQDGDSLTVTTSETLPTGLSISGGSLIGTPTVYGESVITFRATDLTGDYTEHDVTLQVGDLVPNVIGNSQATAVATIEAIASFTTSIIGVSGNVSAQVPEANTLAPYNQDVTLTLAVLSTKYAVRLFSVTGSGTGMPAVSQLNGWLQG